MFSAQNLQQIASLGISQETIQEQIEIFKKGIAFLRIIKPATYGDGIKQISDEQAQALTQFYEEKSAGLAVVKFVPASGAASRMFKNLFSMLEKYDGSPKALEAFEKDQSADSAYQFFTRIKEFACYNDLKAAMAAAGKDLEKALAEKAYGTVLTYLLTEEGLNYGNLPKGLLKFHQYPGQSRTAVEEHLVEGALYCRNAQGQVNLHFTVSPEHTEKFQEKIGEVLQKYQQAHQATYQISFSNQKPYTDTIAVDLQNEPFLNADGSLLFRPGGHGALLENLNHIEADIIFIKNIDNVVPDRLKGETVKYKKLIGAILLKTQEKIAGYLQQLQDLESISDDLLAEVVAFLTQELCVEIPPQIEKNADKKARIAYYISRLNRPLRVCGMVKNEGEPGGGPFWAVNSDGSTSLQIVESAQIDMKDAGQKAIAQQATHFNPVDLVCAVKDYKGNKFDLLQFRDPDTGFISQKSKDGKDLKALELPGLWNGAMSDWNTLFVEVPVITFNPVKTINDLLRKEHQG
jgi:hypothetical protein